MWWIKALQSLLQVLQVGHELARPGAWKNVQLVASLLTALLGILWALGYQIQLLPDDVFAIAGAIVAIINAYLVVATSTKVGLPNVSTEKTSAPDESKPTELPKDSSSSLQSVPILGNRRNDADVVARRMRESLPVEPESRQDSTEPSAGRGSGTTGFSGWNDR